MGIEILYAVLVFTALITIMALGLIYARKQLVPQGDVKIIINGDTENPIMALMASLSLITLISIPKI